MMERNRPTHKHRLAIRMAGEGIPVMAIARTLQTEQDFVEAAIKAAVQQGLVAAMPPHEWPVKNDRGHPRRFDAVGPQIEFGEPADVVNLVVPLMAEFGLSRQQAVLLGLLLVRGQASHPEIYRAIVRNPHTSDPKLTHVVKCRVNEKLDPHSIEIVAQHGSGYVFEPAARLYVLERLRRRCRVPRDICRRIHAAQQVEMAA